MAKKSKDRAWHRADTRGKYLLGLPHVVADSQAYLSLSPFERAVLLEILRRFNGYNNGNIVISYEQIGERLKGRNSCRPNNGRIGKAVARLFEVGLIGEPTPGNWLERRAREYRLTFASAGKGPPFQSATNDYLKWTPTSDSTVTVRHQRSRVLVTLDHQGGSDLGTNDYQGDQSSGERATRAVGYTGSPHICEPYPGVQNVIRVYPRGTPHGLEICGYCGGTLQTKASQPKNQKYCSRSCRKRAEHRRSAARRRLTHSSI